MFSLIPHNNVCDNSMMIGGIAKALFIHLQIRWSLLYVCAPIPSLTMDQFNFFLFVHQTICPSCPHCYQVIIWWSQGNPEQPNNLKGLYVILYVWYALGETIIFIHTKSKWFHYWSVLPIMEPFTFGVNKYNKRQGIQKSVKNFRADKFVLTYSFVKTKIQYGEKIYDC